MAMSQDAVDKAAVEESRVMHPMEKCQEQKREEEEEEDPWGSMLDTVVSAEERE